MSEQAPPEARPKRAALRLGVRQKDIMLRHAICLLFVGIVVEGYSLPPVPTDAKIQVNVPGEGTRTRLITFDVTEGRQLFFDFLASIRKTGMTNPDQFRKMHSAVEVMTVTFWGDTVPRRMSFYILEDTTGRPLDVGYGGVEIYDSLNGFPSYRYNMLHVIRLKDWLDHHKQREAQPDDEKSAEPEHRGDA